MLMQKKNEVTFRLETKIVAVKSASAKSFLQHMDSEVLEGNQRGSQKERINNRKWLQESIWQESQKSTSDQSPVVLEEVSAWGLGFRLPDTAIRLVPPDRFNNLRADEWYEKGELREWHLRRKGWLGR